MKPKLLIQLAAACTLFFALGHSIGHFTRHNIEDTQAQQILKAMSSHKFNMFGQLRSYDDNYTGMSLNLIITLITLTVLLALLANWTHKQPLLVRHILIPLSVCLALFAMTSFLFFFPLPGITCCIATCLLVIAIFKLNVSSV
jgi:hypothetical protein